MIHSDATATNGPLFGVIPDPSLLLRVRVSTGEPKPRCVLERTLAWTAYAIETIVDDGLHAGSRGRVEITVPNGTSVAAVAWMAARFASLRERGVGVEILVSGRVGTRSPPARKTVAPLGSGLYGALSRSGRRARSADRPRS